MAYLNNFYIVVFLLINLTVFAFYCYNIFDINVVYLKDWHSICILRLFKYATCLRYKGFFMNDFNYRDYKFNNHYDKPGHNYLEDLKKFSKKKWIGGSLVVKKDGTLEEVGLFGSFRNFFRKDRKKLTQLRVLHFIAFGKKNGAFLTQERIKKIEDLARRVGIKDINKNDDLKKLIGSDETREIDRAIESFYSSHKKEYLPFEKKHGWIHGYEQDPQDSSLDSTESTRQDPQDSRNDATNDLLDTDSFLEDDSHLGAHSSSSSPSTDSSCAETSSSALSTDAGSTNHGSESSSQSSSGSLSETVRGSIQLDEGEPSEKEISSGSVSSRGNLRFADDSDRVDDQEQPRSEREELSDSEDEASESSEGGNGSASTSFGSSRQGNDSFSGNTYRRDRTRSLDLSSSKKAEDSSARRGSLDAGSRNVSPERPRPLDDLPIPRSSVVQREEEQPDDTRLGSPEPQVQAEIPTEPHLIPDAPPYVPAPPPQPTIPTPPPIGMPNSSSQPPRPLAPPQPRVDDNLKSRMAQRRIDLRGHEDEGEDVNSSGELEPSTETGNGPIINNNQIIRQADAIIEFARVFSESYKNLKEKFEEFRQIVGLEPRNERQLQTAFNLLNKAFNDTDTKLSKLRDYVSNADKYERAMRELLAIRAARSNPSVVYQNTTDAIMKRGKRMTDSLNKLKEIDEEALLPRDGREPFFRMARAFTSANAPKETISLQQRIVDAGSSSNITNSITDSWLIDSSYQGED